MKNWTVLDRTNETFGHWTILGINPKTGMYSVGRNAAKHWVTFYTAQCVCGVVKPVRWDDLHLGKTTSCGCEGRNQRLDYGRLTVKRLSLVGVPNIGRMVECQCACGNTIIVALAKLKNGQTKSCGCLIRSPDVITPGRLHDRQQRTLDLYATLTWIGDEALNNKNREPVEVEVSPGVKILTTQAGVSDLRLERTRVRNALKRARGALVPSVAETNRK